MNLRTFPDCKIRDMKYRREKKKGKKKKMNWEECEKEDGITEITSWSHQGIWSPPVKKFPMVSNKLPNLASIDG
jgi:hypothetical protein